MLREKLSRSYPVGLSRLVSNVSSEIRQEVGRKVCSTLNDSRLDTLKLGVLDACDSVEHTIEGVPIVGRVYRLISGIRPDLLFPRENYRARLRYRVAEILYPDGDPKDLEIEEKYEKFMNANKRNSAEFFTEDNVVHIDFSNNDNK